MSYVPPSGGSRRPAPKPTPAVGRITMAAWRQPTGGVRPGTSAAIAPR